MHDDRGVVGFKSCPRVGGIAPATIGAACLRCFKSCPRVGGIKVLGVSMEWLTGFKSCPRVGGIPPSCWRSKMYPGFKSCPRVGGIKTLAEKRLREKVSSRAPVWGASVFAL